jgi:hypothetical protein
LLSPALRAAIAAAIVSIPSVCPRCESNLGLCHSEKCEREVLPVLRESTLKRDTHSGPFAKRADTVEPKEESTAAKKARRRNERKQTRLDGALASEFIGHTRVRRHRPAA